MEIVGKLQYADVGGKLALVYINISEPSFSKQEHINTFMRTLKGQTITLHIEEQEVDKQEEELIR